MMISSMRLLSAFCFLPSLALSLADLDAILPFSVSGRDVYTANGERFFYAGTNLPGHQEPMIPEGLQYASADEIAQHVVDLGLNSVRITFAIEMIDDILDTGDVGLEDTLVRSLGQTNGTKILGQILEKNPEFTKDTTRLEVFDAVANAFARKEIIVHLDNHVSKAIWCCSTNDGNGWFGEKYFPVENWVRAWGFIAGHAAKNWPSFASVGLRNELRSATTSEPVDWYTWYQHMTAAADAVHETAPDALIFFSGMNFDVTITPIPLGQQLNGTVGRETEGKVAHFNPHSFPYADKIVLEIHKYDFENTKDDCATFGSKWYPNGFQALDEANPNTKYLFPVVLSEWGFIQNGTYWNQTTYSPCLIEFVRKWKFGWMQWALAGSYYIRTRNGVSIHDEDEAWGLLNHDWSDVRSPVTVQNSLDGMINALRV